MTEAIEILRQYNPNMLVGQEEDGLICAIEDVYDPFQRLFRIEHQSTLDGQHAVAYCRHNPWPLGPGNALPPEVGRVDADGLLLLKFRDPAEATREVRASAHTLRETVMNARYWCCVYSALRDCGSPTVQAGAAAAPAEGG